MGPDNVENLVIKDPAGKDITVGTKVAFIKHGRVEPTYPEGSTYYERRRLYRKARRTKTLTVGIVSSIWIQTTDSQGAARRAKTKTRVLITIDGYETRTIPTVV